MVWLAMFVLAVAVFAWFVFFIANGEAKSGAAVVGTGATVVGLLCLALSCFTMISSGHVGVPVLFGDVQAYTFDQGLHPCNPFLSVEEMSVRTESYTMSSVSNEGQVEGNDTIVALSSNGLRMTMDATVPYRLSPSAAPWVYENLGPNFVDEKLRPAARTGIRRATAKFTDQECYSTKRDELAAAMQKDIQNEMDKLRDQYENAPESIVIISSVMLRNVELPDKVKDAIERKLEADQKQQEMDFLIQKEEKEATRKEIEATGIKKFQDIVSEGITPDLLKWKGIEATLQLSESNNAKVVIIGNSEDGMPIILGGQKE